MVLQQPAALTSYYQCDVLPAHACKLLLLSCRAPADPNVVWPDMRPVDIPEGGELPLVLPPAAYAYDFVLAHSMPEDEPELVTGLYCYAEMVIQQVGVGGAHDDRHPARSWQQPLPLDTGQQWCPCI